MSEPFTGEIRMFAGNFAPRGWAFCDGQLLAISQNDALFSLLGTIYGGDGRTTFGLPDMRGRIPVHAGQGPGLSQRRVGAKGGAENVTLTVNQIPSHNHPVRASANESLQTSPIGRVLGVEDVEPLYHTVENLQHTNLQPFLCINFIIALFGIYPSRQ